MTGEREYITPVGEGIYAVNTGAWRVKRPVLDQAKCTHCGLCFIYCPVFSIEKHGASCEINYEYCKGCGICAYECKVKAIAMVTEGGKANA